MDRTTHREPIARARTMPLSGAARRPGDRGVRVRGRGHARARARRARARAAPRGGLSIAILAVVGAVAVPAGAQAATYPTWDELQAAKANTAAGAAAVQQIQALIGQLETNVQVTRAEAERRTDELIEAQQRHDDAVMRANQIQAQADAAAAEAAAAERNAGQVAAQLYRAGTGDVGINLFLDAGNAAATEKLLAKLGSMEKMVERTSGIYNRAQEKQNSATSLAGQAEVARAEREKLRIAAEEALAAAQAAQAAAEAALAESQAKKIELDQQLKFLQDTEAKTTAAYQEGERIRQEEERRRREEAMRAGTPGTVASSGWALPASGRITSGYGAARLDLLRRRLLGHVPLRRRPRHRMLRPDLRREQRRRALRRLFGHATATTCRSTTAAASGRATRTSGPAARFVGTGQWVDAGQNIASSGTTGASTGCHLHFEVWNGGGRINPIPFMADRGIGLG